MGRRSKREKAPIAARRGRVLIAEPHDGLRKALGAHLEAHFEIVAVVGDKAVLDESAWAGSPDVVVCDLALVPRVLWWARRQRWAPGVPIVGLTLHDAPGLEERLRWRRLAACVPKWAAASELTPAIQAAAGRM
jgi:DNA-binding NarL/FixJ family response regulator